VVRIPHKRLHERIDRIFLGEEFPEVHLIKDVHAPRMGASHRLYMHDPKSNFLLALILSHKYDPVKVFASATLHDIVDAIFTRLFEGRPREERYELYKLLRRLV